MIAFYIFLMSNDDSLNLRTNSMRYDTTKNIDARLWLYIFICFHLFCWTLVPAIVRYNLPLDAIEGTIWGHQLEWGYDKNPFMNGWLTALATYLDGQSGWMVYLFSQLSVVACFWAVWQIAKKMLPPVYALISVLLLEVIQYYNFHSIDFNDNTLELGLWGLTIYFFYNALRSPGKWPWIMTGVFAALGMMAKYYTAALLTGMALFLILDANNRKQLKTLPPYLGMIAFTVIILPHTIWLFFHDFITVNYVFKRTSSVPSWTNHIIYPIRFAWQQFEAFLPALVLFLFLLPGKRPRLAPQKTPVSTFNKAFLFYVGLGPFLFTMLLSVIFGIYLRAGWGMPLLSLWGIILLTYIQPNITKAKIYTFLSAIFILLCVMLGAYSISLIDSPDPSSANFPGREIAEKITTDWNKTYHSQLTYVGGSRWVGGNIEFYSKDHPAVYIEWDKSRAPWINENDLRAKGGVFVWEITNNETMPESVRARFPALQNTTVTEFMWHRNSRNLPPIKIGMAVLPPEKMSSLELQKS